MPSAAPTAVPSTPLVFEDASGVHAETISRSPFNIGRLADRDMVLTHPYVSREHCAIVFEHGTFYLLDLGSRHGTFLNGKQLQPEHAGRRALSTGDEIRLGSVQGPRLLFGVKAGQDKGNIKALIGRFQSLSEPNAENSDLEKLRWFLEAARKLNTTGAVEQILASLVETTLQLTKVERGFVFLKDDNGDLQFVAGRNQHGEPLADDTTISRSAMQQATRTAAEFIVTDTLTAESNNRTESMVAQSIRTVICIPLRTRRNVTESTIGEILGVLYLDSRLASGTLTQVDSDLLETIATEAAALVENASLAKSEEASRRYREELNIAAEIQQGLMAVQIPEIPYARITARNIPCKDVGGDFYDVVVDEDGVTIVITDVSGKGVSAALLASTLQGMIYSQMVARAPLEQIARTVNKFICAKDVGKYATMIVLKLTRSGNLQYINCGHVQPLLVKGNVVETLTTSNMPVGLIAEAPYEAGYLKMPEGGRLILVTDGVTEAENPEGEFFGDERLIKAAGSSPTMEDIFTSVQLFANGAPANDDCTMMELRFHSASSA